MHSITVPDDVTFCDPVTDEPLTGDRAETLTFKKFVLATLLADAAWTKDIEAVESALNIRKAVKAFGKPGEALKLEDGDYKRLRERVEKPTNGYGYLPAYVPQLYPFMAAIKEAKKE